MTGRKALPGGLIFGALVWIALVFVPAPGPAERSVVLIVWLGLLVLTPAALSRAQGASRVPARTRCGAAISGAVGTSPIMIRWRSSSPAPTATTTRA